MGVLADYGYAMTCHKAQGSQARNVVVFMEGFLSSVDTDTYYRWAYTACTRASERVMIVV